MQDQCRQQHSGDDRRKSKPGTQKFMPNAQEPISDNRANADSNGIKKTNHPLLKVSAATLTLIIAACFSSGFMIGVTICHLICDFFGYRSRR